MTLLEILVKELPGKGGWPAGVNKMWQDYDRELRSSGSNIGIFTERLADVHRERGIDIYQLTHGHFVYREQYEVALADSKKVAWNGEGLPPVGCRVQADSGEGWVEVIVAYTDPSFAWKAALVFDCKTSRPFWADEFRPIRSEEERKRDEAITGLKESLGHAAGLFDLMRIYSAIEAGKVPHIKIV